MEAVSIVSGPVAIVVVVAIVAIVVVAVSEVIAVAVFRVVAVVVVPLVAELRRANGGHGQGKDLEEVVILS